MEAQLTLAQEASEVLKDHRAAESRFSADERDGEGIKEDKGTEIGWDGVLTTKLSSSQPARRQEHTVNNGANMESAG